MNRRDFLLKTFRLGGAVACAAVGFTPKEIAWAFDYGDDIFMVPVEGGSCSGIYGNNSTENGTFIGTTRGMVVLRQITLDCAGTPASINARTRLHVDSSTSLIFVVYANSSGSPGDRLWYGTTEQYDAGQADTPTVLTDSSIDYEFAAGTYWIGTVSESFGRIYGSSSTGGTARAGTTTNNFPTPTNPCGATDASTAELEIWLSF